MRSLKHQILLLMVGSLVFLAASFIIVFGWYMRVRAVEAAIVKAKTDLATCMEIIHLSDPGPWHVQDGTLYKGQIQISHRAELVDHLAELTGDTVTLFLGDIRVATTVRNANGGRAIGTKVSDAVAQTVLKNGQIYLGEANVLGKLYQTAYEPIRDKNGNIIGIFYVGISKSYTQAFIVNSLIQLVFLGLGLTVIVVILTWLFIQRVIISPIHEITLGTRNVATGHTTEKVHVTSSQEMEDLAVAFNQMVERLGYIADEMSKNILPSQKGEYIPLANERINGVYTNETPEEVENQDGSSATTTLNEGSNEILNDLYDQCYIGQKSLPKGLNQGTLKQIVIFLGETKESLSAENVAEGVKLTRVTVRRYLDFLEQCGVLSTELKYGTVGRPVKLFSRCAIEQQKTWHNTLD